MNYLIKYVYTEMALMRENSSILSRFFMTKNLFCLIKFDIKIMEACASKGINIKIKKILIE
jgi:hypothetical protein